MSTKPPLMAPSLAVSAFVFDPNKRLLAVLRGQAPGKGLWTVPGGKVRGGETMVEAVAREVLEETGCRVKCGPVLAVIERMGKDAADPYHFVIVTHVALLLELTTPRAASDAAAAEFVDLDDLAKRECTEGLVELARQALGRLGANRH